MSKKVTTQLFVEKSNVIHCNKYSYEKTIYVKAMIKVIVTCPEHGDFSITPNSHTNGSGCALCGKMISSENIIKNKSSTFAERARLVHGNFYCYDDCVYTGKSNKVVILCPAHGQFRQTPEKHLRGHVCKKCSSEKQRLSQTAFIEQANLVHNYFYGYTQVSYKGISVKITVDCPVHGSFQIVPHYHTHNKTGCKKCISYTLSKVESEWLNSLDIRKEDRNAYLKINSKTYCVDAYVPATNTVYEFNGDFFHGNPSVYAASAMNPRLQQTYGFLHLKTLAKEASIKEAGYNLISIWEKDYRKTKITK